MHDVDRRGTLWRLCVAGCFLLSVAATLATIGLRLHPRASYAAPVVGWLSAILLYLGGCSILDRGHAKWSRLGLDWSRQDTIVVIALTLLAAVLRLPGLGVAPRTMLGDEGAMGLEALSVLAGRSRDPFGIGWHSHAVFWFVLQSVSLRLAGDSLAGLRTLSALTGIVTIPATFLLGRLMYGRRIAVIATLLLATYHFHIHFSRLALFNIADPLIGALVLALWIAAMRTGRALYMGAMGVVLGLSLYLYPGARLFFLLIALLSLEQFAGIRRGRSGRPGLRLLLLVLLAAGASLIVATPLLQTYSAQPRAFTARLSEQGILTPGWLASEAADRAESATGILRDQLLRSTLALVRYPDTFYFYDDRRPVVWGLAAPLLVLGVLLLLAQMRHMQSRMLLYWLALTIVFGGILLRDPPVSARYVTLTPVICLLIAQALTWLVDLLPRRVWRPLPHLLASILIVWLSITSVYGYFRGFLPRELLGGQLTHAANALATYLQAQPGNTRVWFMGAPRMYYHGFPMIQFLARRADGQDIIGTVSMIPAPSSRTTVYAALPERAAELKIIEARYPGGQYTTLFWNSQPQHLVEVYVLRSTP